MSPVFPATKRTLTESALFYSFPLILLPIWLLGQHAAGAIGLAATLLFGSIILFRQRKSLRTSFLVPLCCIPFLAASYAQAHGWDFVFVISVLMGLVCMLAAGLTNLFWSPYADDLAELRHSQDISE